MITVNDHHTRRLFDPWEYLGPKRRKLLDTSWSGVFRKYLLEKLPVNKVAKHFDEVMGRPSKELYTAIGALILQQLHDLSDPEVSMTLAFNEQWHYALDITDESDASKYLSERTLRNYRRILIEANLDKVLFAGLTDTLITSFGIDTSKQRLDSTIIRSNMRKYGRILICVTTIRKFLKKLRRIHKTVYDSMLTAEFIERYLAKNTENLFSQVKPSETSRTLQDLGNDLVYLIELFRAYGMVCALPEYRLLERVLHEQFRVKGSGSDTTVTVRPPKDVPSDSLQNPSDPDAAYDAHKGSGYQAQIMETYHDTERDKQQTNLITHVEVEPANIHDSHAVQPAIDAVSNRDCKPDTLVCDTLYGSDDNVLKAAARGIEIIAPVQGNAPTSTPCLSDFTFDPATNAVIRCPEGNEPEWAGQTIRDRYKATFTKATCTACPLLNRCPVYQGKKASYLYYDDTELRTAHRRNTEQTTEFKDRYRWRAGIEGTNSHLKSDVGAGRLRVRGLAAVRFAVILKALALNILRCAQAIKDRSLPSLTAFFNARCSLSTLVRIPDGKIHSILSKSIRLLCFNP